jgi:hypothetical protein
MQGFESLLYRLVTSETGPLVVPRIGTELGLMQPVGRAVHLVMFIG